MRQPSPSKPTASPRCATSTRARPTAMWHDARAGLTKTQRLCRRRMYCPSPSIAPATRCRAARKMAEARHGIRLAEPLNHWLRKAFDSSVGLTDDGPGAGRGVAWAAMETRQPQPRRETRLLRLARRAAGAHRAGRGRARPAHRARDADRQHNRCSRAEAPAARGACAEAAPVPACSCSSPASDAASSTTIRKSPPSSATRPPSCSRHRSPRFQGISLTAPRREEFAALKRPLHTLKGGARMAGVAAMGDLSHELESLIIGIELGNVPPSSEARDGPAALAGCAGAACATCWRRARRSPRRARCFAQVRALSGAAPLEGRRARCCRAGPLSPREARHAERRQPNPLPSCPNRARGRARSSRRAGHSGSASPRRPQVVHAAANDRRPSSACSPALPCRRAANPRVPPERAEMARVDAELLNQLLNQAGEVSIARSRVEQQLGSVEFNLARAVAHGHAPEGTAAQARDRDRNADPASSRDRVRAAHRFRSAGARPLFLHPAVLARAGRNRQRRGQHPGAARIADPATRRTCCSSRVAPSPSCRTA